MIGTFFYHRRNILTWKTCFYCRLTFWSRHSTKVRKDISCITNSEKEKANEATKEDSSQKTKIQLAVEAANFLYESKKLKM